MTILYLDEVEHPVFIFFRIRLGLFSGKEFASTKPHIFKENPSKFV